jgi:hypothetical protein
MRPASVVVLGALAACGRHAADPDAAATTDAPAGDIDASADAAAAIDAPATPDGPSPDAGPPQTLADTGLCADAACTQINPGIRAYTPRWALWSDAASKRRWIYLPPGTQIDTTDMNWWHFPQGTKLWKEFSLGTTKLETRMYWKQGPTDNDWYQVSFVWNAAQDMAIAAPTGAQDINGTDHDAPARSDCRKCHERTPGRILGFSALQLDAPAATGEIALDDLVSQGLLSKPPTKPASGPYFPLWPDATAQDAAALGYLHANCGHCHNEGSDVFNICPRVFHLDVAQLGSVHSTSTYITTIKQTPSITIAGYPYVVAPGAPDQSALYFHFTTTDPTERMPPLATEHVDPTGMQILHDWIAQIPAN